MTESNVNVIIIEYNLTRRGCLGFSFLSEDNFAVRFRPATVISRHNHPSIDTACRISDQSEKDCWSQELSSSLI
jgi:hypothetical protein